MKKSSNEVKIFVAQYFHERKITHQMIGNAIGHIRQSVTNMLSDKTHYFTKKVAVGLHYKYGFAMPFLLEGKGEPFLPSLTMESITKYVENRLNLLHEIATNSVLLANLGGIAVNQDVLKGMEHAFNEILEYINSGQHEKFEVTLFVLGLPYNPNNTKKVEVEANSQQEAEQKAHDKYVSDGWGVYDSVEVGVTKGDIFQKALHAWCEAQEKAHVDAKEILSNGPVVLAPYLFGQGGYHIISCGLVLYPIKAFLDEGRVCVSATIRKDEPQNDEYILSWEDLSQDIPTINDFMSALYESAGEAEHDG